MTMNPHLSRLYIAIRGLGIASGLSCAAFAATPILEFTFNETGATASSSGSAAVSGNMWNSAFASTDLHGSSGSGVSGTPGDRAFDNSSSTGMGSAGTGGVVNLGDAGQIDGLSSFTLQGWFNTSTAIGNAARLFDKNTGGGTSGFLLRANTTAGQLVLTVNNQSAVSSTSFGATNSWVFFAVTFDGTLATNNVNFYVGSSAASVSLVTTATVAATQSIANGIVATLGNTSWLASGAAANNRPFDGQLDNMRIYGASSGAGGVLSLAELEAVRLADATPIPEPSAAAALVGALGLGLAASTRRRPTAHR